MLPNSKGLKQELLASMTRRLYSEHSRKEGFLSLFPPMILHEGSSPEINVGSGIPEASSVHSAQAEFSIAHDEFESLTLQDIAQRMGDTIDKLIEQKAKTMLNLISEDGKKLISFNSREEAQRGMLNRLEEMQIEFDKYGNPILPPIFMHPDSFAKLVQEDVGHDDTEFYREQEKIFVKKREEWRARENNRKLVG